MPKLYSALRGLLTANDYTQEQFARAVGIPYGTVKDHMRGLHPWTLSECYQTLDLFGVAHSRLHEIFPKDGRKREAAP